MHDKWSYYELYKFLFFSGLFRPNLQTIITFKWLKGSCGEGWVVVRLLHRGKYSSWLSSIHIKGIQWYFTVWSLHWRNGHGGFLSTKASQADLTCGDCSGKKYISGKKNSMDSFWGVTHDGDLWPLYLCRYTCMYSPHTWKCTHIRNIHMSIQKRGRPLKC